MLGVLVLRRVRPSWGGLSLVGTVGYVAMLVVAQLAVVFAAAGALIKARGCILLPAQELFKPVQTYNPYVAKPYELSTVLLNSVERTDCDEPLPLSAGMQMAA